MACHFVLYCLASRVRILSEGVLMLCLSIYLPFPSFLHTSLLLPPPIPRTFLIPYERYTAATTQPPLRSIACVPKCMDTTRTTTYAAVAPRTSIGFAVVKRLANTVKRIKNPDITPSRISGLECVLTRCWSSQNGPINIARPSIGVVHFNAWSTTPSVW